MDTLPEGQCKLTIISCWILLGMRNVWDKVAEKIKTNFLFNFFFLIIMPFMK